MIVNNVTILDFAVKLPELLVHANIEKETMVQLQEKLADFLKYFIFPSKFHFNIYLIWNLCGQPLYLTIISVIM